MHEPSRRDVLRAAAATGAATALQLSPYTWMPAVGDDAAASRELVRRENAKAGSLEWLLTNTRVDPATQYRCPWIEGYASRTRGTPSAAFRYGNVGNALCGVPVAFRKMVRETFPTPQAFHTKAHGKP